MGTLVLLVAVWGVGLWGMRCIRKTGRQRVRLLDYIFSQPNWPVLLAQFDAVDFDDHLFSLATFRDPMRLYANSLREVAV
jgi:hypothetical protein